jgi:hypothetical protein
MPAKEKSHEKILTILTAVTAAALLAGCSQPSDSSGGTVSSTPASVTYPAVRAGLILKNSYTESTDTYGEYLQFTTAEGGTYSMYKNGTLVTLSDDGTSMTDITFTYAPSTGILTLSDKTKGYIFMVIGTTYYWTHFQFRRTSGSGLFGMWVTTDIYDDGSTSGFSFSSDGTVVEYKNEVQVGTGTFTNDNGYITITSKGNTLPYTIIYSSDDNIYFSCFTMTPVSEVGKQAAADRQIELPSVSNGLFASHASARLIR